MTRIIATLAVALAVYAAAIEFGYARGMVSGGHSSARGPHAVWNARTGR
jgi:hypothetical protein